MRKRDCNFCSFWQSSKKEEKPFVSETNNNLFLYKTMDEEKSGISGNLRLINAPPFYEIQARKLPAVGESSWKFHLSLQEYIENVEVAWDQAILPLIFRYGINSSKIISRSSLRGEKGEGNIVTIYLYANPEFKEDFSKLSTFVNRLEAALINLNVIPGPIPLACEGIKGSQYIFFRCETPVVDDKDPKLDLPYITPEDAIKLSIKMNTPAYNPANHFDPYRLTELDINEDHFIEEAHHFDTILSLHNRRV